MYGILIKEKIKLFQDIKDEGINTQWLISYESVLWHEIMSTEGGVLRFKQQIIKQKEHFLRWLYKILQQLEMEDEQGKMYD